MLLFYINASASAAAAATAHQHPLVATHGARIPVSFAIPGQEPIETTVLEDIAIAHSQFFKAAIAAFGGESTLPVDLGEHITSSSKAHKKIVDSVIIPLLNGTAPTIDWRLISGEEAAVLMEYLEFLGIDPQQDFGPIKWVEEFGARGVEVSDPTWTIEFLKYAQHRRLSISFEEVESDNFLQDLTEHPKFEEVAQGGGSLSLSLGNSTWHHQAEALQKLKAYFVICDLVNVVVDKDTAGLLSDMVNLNRLGLLCEFSSKENADALAQANADALAQALDALAKAQLDNQSSLQDRILVGPKLQHLNLIGLFDYDVRQLAPVIAKFNQLTHLTVGHYEDADEGAKDLAEALKALTQLTHLTVKGYYGDEGAKDLAEALKALTRLTHLTVKGSYGDEGATDLAEALQALTLLTHLTVNGWYEDAGTKALANALKALTQLTHLTVDGHYRDAGVKDLAETLRTLRQLTHLAVYGWYYDEGAKDLAETLKTLTQLTDLNVWGHYGAEGEAAIDDVKRQLGIPVN